MKAITITKRFNKTNERSFVCSVLHFVSFGMAVQAYTKGNAYRNISFEKEAYDNENDMDYIDKREHFSWIEYI